jgi:CMP-N-acetylneuraminic acid synthetase
MAPVMQHALAWLKEAGEAVDALVLLQPSSPLRRGSHIDEAIELFLEKAPDTVVSVVPIPHIFHPRKALKICQGALVSYMDDGGGELDAAYGRNGPAILINRPGVIERGERFGETILPYIMAPEDSIDIDEPLDLALAEFLLLRRGDPGSASKSTQSCAP